MQLVQARDESVLVLALIHTGWVIGDVSGTLVPDTESFDLHDVWSVFHQTQVAATAPDQFSILSSPCLLIPILGSEGALPLLRVTPSAIFAPEDQSTWRGRIADAERDAIARRTGLSLPKRPVGDVSKLRTNGA